MLTELLKCFAIGLCASAPVGPVAVQVVQRSLAYGRRAGLVSGLGAATVDTLYAVVSIFFLGFFQRLIDTHTQLLLIIGGVILTSIGLLVALSNPFRGEKRQTKVKASFYFQTLLSAISNPAALVLILTLFTLFKVDSVQAGDPAVFAYIACVAAGTFVWWFTLSWAVAKLRDKFRLRTLLMLSRTAGVCIAVFGIVLFVKAFI